MGIIKTTKKLVRKAKAPTKDERQYELLSNIQKITTTKSGYVAPRDEATHDFAAVCLKCDKEYPKEHVHTFMGRCVECAEKKINFEKEDLKNKVLKTAIACVIVFIIEVALLGIMTYMRRNLGDSGMLNTIYDLMDTDFSSFFITMEQIVLFVILSNYVKRRFVTLRPAIVYILVGVIVFLALAAMPSVLTIVFLSMAVLFVYKTVKKLKEDKQMLIKFKRDTVTFNARIMRMEEVGVAPVAPKQSAQEPQLTAESTGEGEVFTGQSESVTPYVVRSGAAEKPTLGVTIEAEAASPAVTDDEPTEPPVYYDI